MDAPPPPFHKKVVRDVGAVDRRNIARMHAPGIFFMETLFSPAGSGAGKGNFAGGVPRRACPGTRGDSRRRYRFTGNIGPCTLLRLF